MVTQKRVVVWNKQASKYFREAYEWIKKDSYSNAEKVKNELVKIIDSLPDNPEKFPPDKFKINNHGAFRAFEKYSFRIAYKFTDQEIRGLRMRHVKQEPKLY